MIEEQAVAATAAAGEQVQQVEMSCGIRHLIPFAASVQAAHSRPAEAMAEGEEVGASSAVGRKGC